MTWDDTRTDGQTLHATEWNDVISEIKNNRATITSGLNLGYRERPMVQHSVIGVKSKPVLIQIGVFSGYEMPVSTWSDDQYIFVTHSVPRRWDGTTNPVYTLACILGTANTDKKFKMRASWRHFTPDGDIVPITSRDVDTETSIVGAQSQYKSYKISFTIDYDYFTPDILVASDVLSIKVGRVDASSAEATGNIIILGGVLNYRRDKIGITYS